jgi:hypothetical protein
MPRTSVATDDFNRASLGSNWTNLNTTWGTIVTQTSTVFTGTSANTGNEAAAVWAGAGSFTDDQYSEGELGGLTFLTADYCAGYIARASADTDGNRDFYFFYVAGDSSGPNYTTVLGKVVNGTRTVLHSASAAWANTDLISIECEGTTIRGCKNGTPLGGSFTQTDSSLTTGKPGILANGSSLTGDNWVGGNITSGGSSNAVAWLRA